MFAFDLWIQSLILTFVTVDYKCVVHRGDYGSGRERFDVHSFIFSFFLFLQFSRKNKIQKSFSNAVCYTYDRICTSVGHFFSLRVPYVAFPFNYVRTRVFIYIMTVTDTARARALHVKVRVIRRWKVIIIIYNTRRRNERLKLLYRRGYEGKKKIGK